MKSIASEPKYRKYGIVVIASNRRDYYLQYKKKWNRVQRLRALRIVGKGKVRCQRCGCNEIDLLEINHKNGGGRQEFKHGYDPRDIAFGKRRTDDLNLLCMVCNMAHYAEREGKTRYKIQVIQ